MPWRPTDTCILTAGCAHRFTRDEIYDILVALI